MTQIITPWEVKGEIDYHKLIAQFGLKPFKPQGAFTSHVLIRRGIIFAQRDFERIEKAILEKKPFVMMTGLMPSGQFHFGHKMVADQIILYQKLGAKIYLAVADIEAYNTRDSTMTNLRDVAIEEYLTNYVALGLDLDKCDFYFQSRRSPDGKKSNAYYRLAGLLAKHATFNEFKAVYGDINPAKMASSLLQASDMLHAQLPEFEGKRIPIVIPVGADQDPHIRLARDMSQRIKHYDFLQISSTYHKFLPGLKGGKMSSSDPTSFIALTDSIEKATLKIKKYAFSGGRDTLKEHRLKGGNPEIDVSYNMLHYGFEEDDKKLQKIYDDYKTGKLLSGEIKGLLIEKMTIFLTKHQKERQKAKKKVQSYLSKQNF